MSIRDIVEFNITAGNEFKKRGINHPLFQTYLSLIDEEFNHELPEALSAGDIEDVTDALVDTLIVTAGAIYSLGISPEEALSEVTSANNSKWCLTEQDAIASVKAYEGDSRYFDVHYELVNGLYVIKGRKTDADENAGLKILKGINTRKPDFKKILEKREMLK